jgi:F0F1-type ATP synthase assembly protein I
MPDTPESTRSDLAQLAAGSDEDQADDNTNKNGNKVSVSTFNFVSSVIGTGIIGIHLAFLLDKRAMSI